MNNNKTLVLTVASMWFATALAVGIGIVVTKSANCLWAMFIPALSGVKVGNIETTGL